MACKEGQFDVVELMVNDQFKTFSINLNGQHVNGMTPLICFFRHDICNSPAPPITLVALTFHKF